MFGNKSLNSGPGYKTNPEHKITLLLANRRMKVIFDKKIIADSNRAINLKEGSYPDVLYFPLEDVCTEVLKPTQHETYCPFKGTASYWSIISSNKIVENAVWGYKTPYIEVDKLKGCVAFYVSKVDEITQG